MGFGPQSGELRDKSSGAHDRRFPRVTNRRMQFFVSKGIRRENSAAIEDYSLMQDRDLPARKLTCRTSKLVCPGAGRAPIPGFEHGGLETSPHFVYYHEPSNLTDQHSRSILRRVAGNVTLWAKTNSVGAGFRMFVYYTSDGTWPEGADGVGIGTTTAVEMHYKPQRHLRKQLVGNQSSVPETSRRFSVTRSASLKTPPTELSRTRSPVSSRPTARRSVIRNMADDLPDHRFQSGLRQGLPAQ